jgi:hypothetical protein
MPIYSPDKPKEERLKETIQLLKRLQEAGIHHTDPGYTEIKRLLSEWVRAEPVPAVARHMIEFPRYGRQAFLVLPKRADRAAEITLKVAPGVDTRMRS